MGRPLQEERGSAGAGLCMGGQRGAGCCYALVGFRASAQKPLVHFSLANHDLYCHFPEASSEPPLAGLSASISPSVVTTHRDVETEAPSEP